VKKELGFEGIKGGEKGKEGAFFFWGLRRNGECERGD
jgi:hypothetical protein